MTMLVLNHFRVFKKENLFTELRIKQEQEQGNRCSNTSSFFINLERFILHWNIILLINLKKCISHNNTLRRVQK